MHWVTTGESASSLFRMYLKYSMSKVSDHSIFVSVYICPSCRPTALAIGIDISATARLQCSLFQSIWDDASVRHRGLLQPVFIRSIVETSTYTFITRVAGWDSGESKNQYYLQTAGWEFIIYCRARFIHGLLERILGAWTSVVYCSVAQFESRLCNCTPVFKCHILV
jgi:hypothetical protein